MRDVFILDCEVVEVTSETDEIVLPHNAKRIWVRAGDEFVELVPKTLTRTRRLATPQRGVISEVREVSVDAGRTWTTDARYVRGTSSQPHHAIKSEEL